ncbi:MAG TPA: SHOCT domain-containing protein [Pseudonocardiaceae bacterium]|jgi:putative membrane protein|nr:SHOCT domain-containing protein [Pseudonocardiaceae bacterium]
MMYWYGTGAGMTGWGYLFMVIGMVLPWVVIIGGGVWLARFLRTGRHPGTSAEQLLAARFARGELDEDEYRHRLTVIQRDAATGKRG